MQIYFLRIVSVALLLGLPARGVNAQTLQLPTFRYFAIETSVLVPDRGGAALGGVGRSSSGSSQFGPGRAPRAFGGAGGAGGLRVSAFVHDFEMLDQAVLAKAAQLRDDAAREKAAKEKLALPAGRAADPLKSVAEIRRRQAADSNSERDETGGYLERARAAVAAGKPSVARVYFQMAERRASAPLKAQIRAELTALPSATQAALRQGKY